MLSRVGVETSGVANGRDAVELARRQEADIVFLDIRLPDADGFEVRNWIGTEPGAQSAKTVAVTASVFEHEKQLYREQGFDDFIAKPVRAERLYACLSQLLGVQFDIAETEDTARSTPIEEMDWQGFQLPPDLAESLASAVRMHSITDLRRHLEAVDELGHEGQQLATALRDLAASFDLEGVMRVLTEVGVSDGEADN